MTTQEGKLQELANSIKDFSDHLDLMEANQKQWRASLEVARSIHSSMTNPNPAAERRKERKKAYKKQAQAKRKSPDCHQIIQKRKEEGRCFNCGKQNHNKKECGLEGYHTSDTELETTSEDSVMSATTPLKEIAKDMRTKLTIKIPKPNMDREPLPQGNPNTPNPFMEDPAKAYIDELNTIDDMRDKGVIGGHLHLQLTEEVKEDYHKGNSFVKHYKVEDIESNLCQAGTCLKDMPNARISQTVADEIWYYSNLLPQGDMTQDRLNQIVQSLKKEYSLKRQKEEEKEKENLPQRRGGEPHLRDEEENNDHSIVLGRAAMMALLNQSKEKEEEITLEDWNDGATLKKED